MKKLEQKNFTDTSAKNEDPGVRVGRFELPEIDGNMEVDEKNSTISETKKGPIDQINIKQNL